MRDRPLLSTVGRTRVSAALALGLALGLCACGSLGSKKNQGVADQVGVYKVRNVVGDPKLPAYLQRVVLLPVWGSEQLPPESAAALDPVFSTELGKQMRFEVVTVSRDEIRRRYGVESLASTSALPADFLKDMSRDYGAQGVLFIDITNFHAYKPLVLGVRAKLADVSEARLIWTVDEVISAENPAVANGVEQFFASKPAPGEVPLNPSTAAMESPSRFCAYVASIVFRTLPPR